MAMSTVDKANHMRYSDDGFFAYGEVNHRRGLGSGSMTVRMPAAFSVGWLSAYKSASKPLLPPVSPPVRQQRSTLAARSGRH